jgi:hypothetical protein
MAYFDNAATTYPKAKCFGGRIFTYTERLEIA